MLSDLGHLGGGEEGMVGLSDLTYIVAPAAARRRTPPIISGWLETVTTGDGKAV